MDEGRKRSEKELKKLEKRISAEYSKAAKEAQEKLNKHLDDFARKTAVKQKQLRDGIITPKQYNDWRIGQVMMGRRWELMVEDLTKTMNNADKVAAEMMNDHMKDVYAINRNFAEYTIDIAIGYHMKDFAMYDKATVTRLLTKDPKMLPDPTDRVLANVAAGRAQLWERRQIQSVMLQGILQGESIPKIAKRSRKELGESWYIEEIKDRNKKTAKQISRELERRNRNAAIRNARTMTTSAENAGRMDCFKQAQDMGISLQKTWIATNDSRTRKSHAAQDGETVPLNEEFSNGLMYPADLNGAPEEVYNCRCSLVADVDTSKTSSGLDVGESVKGMDFEDWEGMMQ